MKRIIVTGPAYCAVTENGRLMEYISRGEDDRSGDILLGRVERIMAGMNCAFVDIGRKKNGFLPLDEASASFSGGKIRSGEMIILQVKKEEHDDKGAFLTRDVTLPGKLIILMPANRYIGVSARIRDEDERERLKAIGRRTAEERFGLVMRYGSAGAAEGEIRKEAAEAFARWERICEKACSGGKPGTILFSGDEAERLKEDYLPRGVDEIREQPEPDTAILSQLRQASERKLALPAGGNIVIDRCEAMTVIDVNTASAPGAGNKEQTVLQTNLEACALIAQQVRLRNLSGIILVDFIDMDEETDRSLVLTELEKQFQADRIKTVIHGWTKLGLMEMTRKRTRRERTE